MLNKKSLCNALAVFAAGVLNAACAADSSGVATERLDCGKVRYVLTSDCKPARDRDSLNVCKPQSLAISAGGATRTATLPELNKVSAQSIVESGGKVKNLFVTQWACVPGGGADVAVLYYSIGGGSAPYGEAYAIYDETGKVIEDEDSALYERALEASEKRMKKVKSIMPR